jgi:murein DD-endopeptidase MepM/ murein hydrolase activator NlpD
MFAIKKGKQKPARFSESPRSNTLETVRFRRRMWLANTGVIVASAALASILPAQPNFTPSSIPSSTQTDPGEIIRSAFLVGPLDRLRDMGLEASETNWSGVNSVLSAVGVQRIEGLSVDANSYPPGKHLIIRTGSADLAQPILQALAWSAQLTPPTPPYTAVGSGNFEIRLTYRTGTIERSFLRDSRDAGLSDPLVLKLAEIFGWDIDFALDVREGDSFVAICEEKYWFGRKIADGAIAAAEFFNRGRVYRAIGVREADGTMSYFTPEGKSLRRTFLRTPVRFSSVSSRFSNARYHPILKTWRAHNGVDYSAPIGTPVRATASGRVVSIGWNGGYGKTVVIKHEGIYGTLYAHLSGYRANLRVDEFVEQGNVIGYVGQTGLATGPHLHYEFQVAGHHRNPLTFNFPEGELVAPALHEDFFRAARAWSARLDLISGRQLAAR